MPPSPAPPRSLVWPILGALGLAVLVAIVVVELYAFRTPSSEVETQAGAPGSTVAGTAGTGAGGGPAGATGAAPSSLPVTTPPGPTTASTTTAPAKGGPPPQAPAGCENVGAVVTTGQKVYAAVDPVNVRSAPRSCGVVLARVPAGTTFQAKCIASGDTIAAGAGGPNSDTFANAYWVYTFYGTQAGWVSDAVLATKDDRDDRSVIPSCY